MEGTPLLILLLSFIYSTVVSQEIIPVKVEDKNYSGTYIVVAPKTFRPGLPYAVSINILKTRHTDNIVRVEIRNGKNESIAQTYETNVVPGSPRTATIDPISPSLLVDGGQYSVYVSGENLSGTKLFESQQSLQYNPKSLSIFVQTDKAVYKPGAVVNFRVIVVKPDLKPYTDKINVKVHDPRQNVISQHLNQSLTKGVFGGKVQLSDDPPLGDWKIEVRTLDGFKFEKTFSVDKYVLPKFEVKVEPPPTVTVNDDIPVIVKAKYTYGKGVAGSVRVVVSHPWSFYRAPNEEKGPLQTTLELDEQGEAIVGFSNEDLKERELITEWGYNRIQFIATVTEGLTGIERNGTAEVMTYRFDTKVKITTPAENFKPGLKFKFVAAAVLQDDSPIPKSYSRKAKMYVHYSLGRGEGSGNESLPTESEEETMLRLGEDGTKEVEIVPPDRATNIRITVSYDPKGEVKERADIQESKHLSAAKSPSQSYLQISPEQGPVPAGRNVEFKVKLTDTVPAITWQVVSRGYVVLTQTQQMSGDMGKISFVTTSEMAPKSKLVVYTVLDENKEIVVDATDFRVEGLFKNQVTLSMDRTEAEPGTPVEVRVTADPGSFVGLCAVDQSVLLLKSGNDITPELVESDVAKYDTTGFGGGFFRPWEGPVIMDKKRRRKRSIWYPWWGIGGKDAKTVFQNSGLVVLTDALLYSEPHPSVMWKSAVIDDADGGIAPQAVEFAPAGPSAAEKAGASRGKAPAPKVRSEFPETWIWTDSVTLPSGEFVYKAKVPDTITSWITSAFAVNDNSGLGVAPLTAKLKVFRPFFIQLNLPYSVKRGEKMGLQVLIFNYMSSEQSVLVTLEKNPAFSFVEKSGPGKKPITKNIKFNQRKVRVPGNGGSKTVFFPIVPTKIGDIKLELNAISGSANDAIKKVLKVEPEGFQVDKNVPIVLDLSSERQMNKSITLDFPPEVIDGSERAQFAVIGDVMGPVLSNIENLVRMPYGCGEQNMLNFVPNIVVLRYLRAISRAEPSLEAKAKKYMEAGYQRELTYKRRDNSFSAFGESDSEGSTWLTAFVVRAFHQAKQFIFVDEGILTKALGFLKGRQKENGEYEERGEVHHKDMQGGSAQGGVPLTAYVLVALLQNGQSDPDALNYIESSLDQIRDKPYAIAVASYALHLANSQKKDEAFQMLQSKAQEKGGEKFWTDTVGGEEGEEDRPWYWSGPKAVDVEMTAYALLSYMQRGDTNGALPIIKWLTAQRNAYGGYSSTQDTVMALQALGAYAEAAYSPEFDVAIRVKNGNAKHSLSVKPENAILFQKVKLGSFHVPVEVSASGQGAVFAQVSWSYNVAKLPDNSPFQCDNSVSQKNADNMLVSMCCKYKKGKSNMAVMEIDALSGFEMEEEAMLSLTQLKDLQRVELAKGQTKANIYFNSLSSSPVCFNVSSQRVFPVSEQKPGFAVLYDYYKPNERADMVYSSRKKRSLEHSCPDCWRYTVTAAPGEEELSTLVEEEPPTAEEGTQEQIEEEGGTETEEEPSEGGESEGECRDRKPNCGDFCPGHRTDREFQRWIRHYCPLTCGLCPTSSGPSSTEETVVSMEGDEDDEDEDEDDEDEELETEGLMFF
jgi:CD109 antigen